MTILVENELKKYYDNHNIKDLIKGLDNDEDLELDFLHETDIKVIQVYIEDGNHHLLKECLAKFNKEKWETLRREIFSQSLFHLTYYIGVGKYHSKGINIYSTTMGNACSRFEEEFGVRPFNCTEKIK